MPNRLAHESSPYLLQHANNPVDWYPWGEEALARAKEEQRPIFLSIGYSACHWCHVMEHESFESGRIAALMNEHFVCVKVDREERPDLDAVYMQAVQLMTRRGGWPMSVFLTPDLQPFFGGTYWPPTERQGMPGFDQVLLAVNDAWQNRRDQAVEQAKELTKYLQASEEHETEVDELSEKNLFMAATVLERTFDDQHGGFGGAPKFPHSMDLRLLLRLNARRPREVFNKMLIHTLTKMAYGGMYDQLGGGFHRYSVDERWLVPHFEKMLYDNALLATAYAEAFQATGNEEFARVTRETCDYVLRDLTDQENGPFFSTEDADSEGEEGKFYVWSKSEVESILDAAEKFCYVYDVSERGNFEGHSILNLPKSLDQCAMLKGWNVEELKGNLAVSREKLLAIRAKRVRPGLDDKVLVSWNGLMIEALSIAGMALSEPRYVEAAKRAADFLWRELRSEVDDAGRVAEVAATLKFGSEPPVENAPGARLGTRPPAPDEKSEKRLLHTWRHGKAKQTGFLDDYAALANGLVSLYEATGEEVQITRAVTLCEQMLRYFLDPLGGFFFTPLDHEYMITRHKDMQDNAVPSGNSLAATVLLRLAKLTGRADFHEAAIGTLRSATGLIEQYPNAAGQMLLALDFQLGPTPEFVLTGNDKSADWATAKNLLRSAWLPRRVIAIQNSDGPVSESSPLAALFEGKLTSGDESKSEPALYECAGFTCQAPLVGLALITERLHKN